MPVNIAIDGPSGAGKSTIAQAVAGKLGYLYVDTGAIYRAVGLGAKRAGLSDSDTAGIEQLLPGLDIQLRFAEGVQRVYLSGEDVSSAIREHDISGWASRLSAMTAVRAFLLERQRALARENDVIMDGRDIGTVVLPDAQVKIFLTASAEERARRRQEQLREQGQEVDYQKLLADIVARDEADSTRPIAPLRQAEDAVYLDTTGNEFEQSVAQILTIIGERL